MSGSLEAWKMLDLVIQFMFSIGDTGDILPNNGLWFSKMTGLNSDHICANIAEVVTQACASAVEMAKFLRSGHYTSEDNSLCIYLEKIGRFHHARLALLKKILYSVCTGVGFESFTLQNSISGNKFHYYEHIRLARELYGVDIRIFDTELSEKLHQVSVVTPHRNGSKRIAGKQRNMLRYYKRGLFIEKFGTSEQKDGPKTLEFQEDIGRSFFALGRYKYNQLIYDNKCRRWSIQSDISEFYFHPLMTTKQLHATCQSIQLVYECEDPTSYEFFLMEQITCKEDKHEGWNIYCSQHFNRAQYVPGPTISDLTKSWSIITAVINGKGGLVMHCLVLAIIYVECELSDGKYNSFHLVVNPLQFSDHVGGLPYDYVEHCFDVNGDLEMFTISCKDDVIDGAFAVPVLRAHGSDYCSEIEDEEVVGKQWIVVAKSRFDFPRDHLLTASMFNMEYPKLFITEVDIEKIITMHDMRRTREDIIETDVHLDISSVHSDESDCTEASV